MDKESGGFVRVLGRRDVLALAFGAMVGWGWVVLSGRWITTAGSLGAASAFAVGGAVVFLIGLTYSELTAAMPKAGGEHVFIHRALGANASYVFTWSIILGYVSVVAFEAVALPTVLEYLLPSYKHGYLWTVAGYEVHATWVLVGVGASVVVAATNYCGVRPTAYFQVLLTAVIIGVGLLLIAGSLGSAAADAASMQPWFVDGRTGMFAVIVMTPFFFLGFDIIPQAAEEINLPFRAIGVVLLVSVLAAVGWYILVILSVSRALPAETLVTSELATAEAMTRMYGGSWAGKLLIVGGVAGIVTSWNGFYLGASRAIYAMAESGMLPRWLACLHPRYKTPSNAILLVGALTAVAPLLGRQSLVWLVNAGGLAVVLAWVGVSLSFVVLRRREPDMPRPFRVPGGRVVGIVAVIASLLLVGLYLPGSPAALSDSFEWAIICVWSCLGVFLRVMSYRGGCETQIAEPSHHSTRDA